LQDLAASRYQICTVCEAQLCDVSCIREANVCILPVRNSAPRMHVCESLMYAYFPSIVQLDTYSVMRDTIILDNV
jgi:hypothetical protein